jgi:nicotinamidase-related amidase
MFKFRLEKINALFLIVDIQERLASVMSKRKNVIANCLHLIEASRLLSIPIVITEQYPKGLGPTVDEIGNVLPSHTSFEKITFDCCKEHSFSEKIASANRKQVILSGMETHICVLQTCIGLLRQGYTVHIVRDAVCSRKKDDFKTGIELMRDAGAVITSTEIVLFQLLEKAGTEEFKTISKRIK